MVFSRLFEHLEVEYKEEKQLDLQDQEHHSALYVIELFEKEYVIALGNMRTEYSDTAGCIYYPIYLISAKKRIKAKIGIFEVEAQNVISIIDNDGDIDLNKLGEPLLFSFVTSEYLEKHGTNESAINLNTESKSIVEDDDIKETENQIETNAVENNMMEVDESVDIEDAIDTIDIDDDSDEENFVIKVDEKKSKSDVESVMKDDNSKITYQTLFEIDNVLPSTDSWPTETEENAKQMRETYKKTKSIQDNWVMRFMNNKEYKIISNSGNGDCFFIALRDAFSEIGYKTTVMKLRKYLSQEVTDDLYENYRSIYDGVSFELNVTEEEIERLQNANSDLKKQSKNTVNAKTQKEILEEAIKVKQDYTTQRILESGTKELLEEFGFMKHIHSKEEFVTFIQTSDFWADTWALSTMELLLSVKFIVLEDTEDIHSVIRCTQQNHEMNKYDEYNPKYYIFLGRTGNNHYELITYKSKRIFKFSEVPYDIKVKVVKACIERNEQSYYSKIPDFRQFRSELGLSSGTSNEMDIDDDQKALFDPNLTLSFHEKSDVKKKAGVVEGDNIPIKRRTEFSVLNNIECWRRKLHDSWTDEPFTMTTTDKKRWQSIEHYLLAIPYKESHPALYEEFSDDSKSKISKDIKLARLSLVKKNGKIGKYYQIAKETKPLDEHILEIHRKDALREKFKKQTPFGRLLKATNLAKLEIFRRNQSPLTDISLMEVRNE